MMRRRVLGMMLAGALTLTALTAADQYEARWASLDKRPLPGWFQDAKFGIFIHWGVYAVPAYAPVIPGKLAYAEWYWHAMTEGRKGTQNPIDAGTWAMHQQLYGADYDYANFAPQFRAELYDPTHWADIFVRSGARYIVPTSKHHEGFALWPSAEASRDWGRPWNAVETGPKRDVLGELAQAVRARGLTFGIYYSLYEWYNPIYLTDKPRFVAAHLFPQFKDVVTRYKPELIFSDGEWEMSSEQWRSPELLAWLFNESPVKDTVVVDDRWGKDTRHKHGSYWTTEYTPGMADTTHAWEESRGMGFSYGYNRAENIDHYHSSRELVLMLADIVSRGGNLLLNIGPQADGLIPVIMQERLLDMGRWLAVNGEAIYGTTAWQRRPKNMRETQVYFTKKPDALYAICARWPQAPLVVGHVAKADAVTLLGSPLPVAFACADGKLTITPPAVNPGNMPCEYAWTFKIAGPQE
jgi:alpha-L-fucosidase